MQLTAKAEPVADGVWFFSPIGQGIASAGGDTIVLHWIDRTGRDLGEALPSNDFASGCASRPTASG